MTSQPPSIVILRHGPTEWNEQHRWQGGEVDHPLSALGRTYVVTAGQHLLRLGLNQNYIVLSSPMQRAAETAEILLLIGIGCGPVIQIRDLSEAKVGATSGLTEAEVKSQFPELHNEWIAGRVPSYPGGESVQEITARIGRALGELMQFDAPILAVAHKTVIRAVRMVIGIPMLEDEGHLSGVGGWVISSHPGHIMWANIPSPGGHSPMRTNGWTPNA